LEKYLSEEKCKCTNKLKDKALEYIEKMCLVYENSDKSDRDIVDHIIATIYKYAHCVAESHSCYHVHDNWRKNLEEQDWEI